MLSHSHLISHQVFVLDGPKVKGVHIASVLSRDNSVPTPSVGVDKRQVLVLECWKFAALISPSVLSGEHGICVPKLGVDKQKHTYPYLRTRIVVFKHQNLVVISEIMKSS